MLNIKYINELIRNSKLTKTEITKRVGLSRPALDRLLAGSDVRVSTLEKLSEVLEVPMMFFFSGTQQPITIHTSGANSPGMMSGGNITMCDQTEEIRRLRLELSLKEELLKAKEELLAMYRRTNGDSPGGIGTAGEIAGGN
ncbi:MAG: helix-turn-helix transcriptional regulator [Muribaculaceae bacterium]|nr:helix-turn-helix transcriptional regulator [Muribaculaceae bacterium]